MNRKIKSNSQHRQQKPVNFTLFNSKTSPNHAVWGGGGCGITNFQGGWYTHKTSSYITSSYQTSSYQTSSYRMSRIQNVQLPNVQLQNVQDTKRPGHKTSSFCKYKKCVADVLCVVHPCVVRSMGDAVYGSVPKGHVDDCRGSCFLRSVHGVSMHGSHKGGSTAAIRLPIGYRWLNLTYPDIKSAHTRRPSPSRIHRTTHGCLICPHKVPVSNFWHILWKRFF